MSAESDASAAFVVAREEALARQFEAQADRKYAEERTVRQVVGVIAFTVVLALAVLLTYCGYVTTVNREHPLPPLTKIEVRR